MPQHEQRWVKVNAEADQGIADLVGLLNSVARLQTLDSCQGEPGSREAYVYFRLEDWQTTGRFLFELVEPALRQLEGTQLAVEAFSGGDVVGKLAFRAEASGEVYSALKNALSNGHTFGCSCGTECKALPD